MRPVPRSQHRQSYPSRATAGARWAARHRAHPQWQDGWKPGRIVNGFLATLHDPIVNGGVISDRQPIVAVSAIGPTPVPLTIQVQFDTDVWFSAPTIPGAYGQTVDHQPSGNLQQASLINVTPGDVVNLQAAATLLYAVWHWRARAGSSDGTTWGDWTAYKTFQVYPVLGSVRIGVEQNVGVLLDGSPLPIEEIEVNVGVAIPVGLDGIEPVEENVGVDLVASRDTTEMLTENVGVLLVRDPDAYEAVEVDGTTDRPVPHIWWIRPEWGRDGYVFNVYGHGFGATQAQYAGQVLIGGRQAVVSSWSRVPETERANRLDVSLVSRVGAGHVMYAMDGAPKPTVAVGDRLVYDVWWETAGTNLMTAPEVLTTPNGWSTEYSQGVVLTDTQGLAGGPETDLPSAYGAWLHREFVLPDYWAGLSIGWAGLRSAFVASPAVPFGVRVRRFMLLDANRVVKAEFVGDGSDWAPPLTWSRMNDSAPGSTGYLVGSTVVREGHTIVKGNSVADEIRTPEHGKIVAIVPTGAESGQVKVRLTQ